jgi:plasmid maintenance system antidote protein VapI
MIHFGECLKTAQSEKKISSSDLAKLLGVHRQQVAVWRNKKSCRLDTAIKICRALDYKLDEFCGL